MRIKLLVAALAIALSSCSDDKPKNTQAQSEGEAGTVETMEKPVDINVSFENFKQKLIDDLWSLNPGYALYVGYYKFDDQLVIPDAAYRNKQLNFLKSALNSLLQFDEKQLNANNASDYFILKNMLEGGIWESNALNSYQWNPANYNVAGAFGLILNTDYKSLDERLRVISKRMDNIPAYYEAAKNNIGKPTIPHTELAIQQNKGAVSVFDTTLRSKVAQSGLSEDEKKSLEEKIVKSVEAINGYVSWLQDTLTRIEKEGAKDFRIGKELYEQKFKYDIYSGYSAEQLYHKAVSEKDRIHGEMITITQQLWPKYFEDAPFPKEPLVAVKALIDHIAVKHVKRDEFIDQIKHQIPELEKFVIEHNLLEMDPEKPLVVRETPEYQRGFAGASINAPGPYDAKANTYYNVTPLDHYTDEQAESYLREYNHWILQILNIHEAVPGHYTQLVHSNKSPSLIKSIFSNGAMVEGWAVYTERMMLEEGYGDNEPELWLMYYKWNLRVVMNSILDYSIQVLGMEKQEAMELMMEQAFQERAEAEGKWRRATLSQVQLTSYFTGYSEIYDFREELKKATGEQFDLADFHNQFLSYGSAPVPIIKQLMKDDYIKKHQ